MEADPLTTRVGPVESRHAVQGAYVPPVRT